MHARKYEYVLPDGYELRPVMRKKLDDLVEETALTNTEAQQFIDLHVELMEEYAAELLEASGGSIQ